MDIAQFKAQVREAVANYMASEGCSCCRSYNHSENAEVLGDLLEVEKSKDGSCHLFYKYESKK